MMSDKEFERISEIYKACGRMEGTLLAIKGLIDMGLIDDLQQVVEIIESNLRKEKKGK